MKTLGPRKNFLAIESTYSSLESSRIAIVSAPYEHTVSYGGGAARGPGAIIDASAYVEFYDDEFDRELCFKAGIATLKPLDFGKRVDQDALDLINKNVAALIDAGKFVVTLGGEHTISTAPILAHLEKYPGMSLLHFDAHSDLRDSYEGSKYSHASFAARVAERMSPERITQVGIRAQCREEAEFIRDHGVNTLYANAIRRGVHGEYWQKSAVDTLGEEVYVTFDVDYFDPAIMPSTGTPEPDGFLYSETLDLFRTLIRSGRRIVGFDVVELAPVKGISHPNLLTARLVYKMLNYAFAESLPPYPRLERLAEEQGGVQKGARKKTQPAASRSTKVADEAEVAEGEPA
jgi:agmatinase